MNFINQNNKVTIYDLNGSKYDNPKIISNLDSNVLKNVDKCHKLLDECIVPKNYLIGTFDLNTLHKFEFLTHPDTQYRPVYKDIPMLALLTRSGYGVLPARKIFLHNYIVIDDYIFKVIPDNVGDSTPLFSSEHYIGFNTGLPFLDTNLLAIVTYDSRDQYSAVFNVIDCAHAISHDQGEHYVELEFDDYVFYWERENYISVRTFAFSKTNEHLYLFNGVGFYNQLKMKKFVDVTSDMKLVNYFFKHIK